MLTRPLPTRRRTYAGLAAIAAVTIAGLGLTASSSATEHATPDGTAAVAPASPHLRVHRAAKTVMAPMATMDTMPQMESMPQAPTPPAPPPASAEFASVDRTVTTSTNGNHAPQGRYRIITRDKNGHVTISEGNGTPPGISFAEIRRDGCQGADQQQVVSESKLNGQREKHIVAVCTKHIRTLAANEAREGQSTEQAANAHALEGLVSARADLLANSALTADERQRAIVAIDGTIASLQSKATGQP